MATLDEIMSTNPPWTKVRQSDWSPEIYFECWFHSNYCWYGKMQDDYQECFPASCEGWSLWTPPKKKVKRWLWAIPPKSTYRNKIYVSAGITTVDLSNNWTLSDPRTEEEMKPYIECLKILGTEIECDE